MFCPRCGTKVADGTEFCPACGARLQQVTTAETASSQPQASPVAESPASSGVQTAQDVAPAETQPDPTASSIQEQAASQQDSPYPAPPQPQQSYQQASYAAPQAPQYTPQSYQQPVAPQQNSNDTGSFGWAVLGFFIPLVGLILWLVWKNEKPLNAKKAGIGALVGFILSLLLSFTGACTSIMLATMY